MPAFLLGHAERESVAKAYGITLVHVTSVPGIELLLLAYLTNSTELHYLHDGDPLVRPV